MFSSNLSYAAAPSVTGAPVSIMADGSTGQSCATRACVSSVGLTTSNSNDLIVLCASAVSGRTVSSVTDSLGVLSFKLKAGFTHAAGPRIELWYAVASLTLSSDRITVTFSATGNVLSSRSVLPEQI